jgi:cytochrome P450
MTKVDLPGALLLEPSVINNPYPFYRQLREHAPVWEASSTGLFTVSTFELVAEVTGRVDDFSSNITHLFYRDDAGLPRRVLFGEDVGQVLATADPPAHALHRGTVFPELVAKRMETLEPDVVDIANACIDRALADVTLDYMAVVANIVPITVISRLIGFEDSDLDQLLQAAFDSTELLGGTLSLDELGALMARSQEVQAYIADQLAAAVVTPGDDLLGAVARGLSNRVFEEPGALVMLQTLLSAGGESTTSLLGNSVRMLAEDQHLQAGLRSDPKLIPAFVEEALRLESPFRFHMRSTPMDTTLGGVESRPGRHFSCSGAPPTVTPPSSTIRIRSISTDRHHATMSASVAGCTTV